MAAERRFRVRAPAKINLSLRIVGVRADGYHELRTVFQSIALHDTLVMRVRRGPFTLQCDDEACPPDRTNLVWRAAERVWTASGRRGEASGVGIELVKRIPMQGGLGGGSSDAAAALRMLGARWRVDDGRLRRIGGELGADVPYFFEGGTVLGLDRGDVLYPLIDPPAAWVVLVLPDFGVSTAEAYRWFDRERAAARAGRGPGRVVADCGNDLEGPVASHHPQIVEIAGALRRAGAFHAAMSGSGSTVFGLFGARAAAGRAARRLATDGRGGGFGRTLVTRTANRAAYQRLAGIGPIV
jgi:4-diphosphocytidyl-2-C-methyl-D-erythritol kinase